MESPSPNDILDKRTEGESLSSALRLEGIGSKYYQVQNMEMLHECFSRIATLTRPYSRIVKGKVIEHKTFSPHFHISAHGNERGLWLSSGEFLDWNNLRDLLIGYARSMNYMNEEVCLFPLLLSVCQGAFARKMFKGQYPEPCIAIIGPTEKVSWADALTAYITFYHLKITKDMPPQEAVTIMNKAAGLNDVFRYYTFKQKT